MRVNDGYPKQCPDKYENRVPSWTETLMLVTGVIVSVLIIAFIINQITPAMIM